MAYALQLSLPGTPVIRYGDEIGMGDDLSLPDRSAIRTPMQWSAAPNGGFSSAPPKQVQPPVIADGDYGYPRVNVEQQIRDPESLLRWFTRAMRTLREYPEFGSGDTRPVDSGERDVLALVHDAPDGAMLALINLGTRHVHIDLGRQPEQADEVREVFSDSEYDPPEKDLVQLELRPYGYRWIRLRETLGR
jgi:maltose alpha-D-glucosyltransferase/alpha-amylase